MSTEHTIGPFSFQIFVATTVEPALKMRSTGSAMAYTPWVKRRLILVRKVLTESRYYLMLFKTRWWFCRDVSRVVINKNALIYEIIVTC